MLIQRYPMVIVSLKYFIHNAMKKKYATGDSAAKPYDSKKNTLIVGAAIAFILIFFFGVGKLAK